MNKRIVLQYGREGFFVSRSKEVGSKEFDFRVKGFCHGIYRTFVVKVQYFIIVFTKGGNNDIECLIFTFDNIMANKQNRPKGYFFSAESRDR